MKKMAAFILLLAGAMLAEDASAAPDIGIYGNLPSFETATISPSGKFIALVANIDGKRQLAVLDENEKVVVRGVLGSDKLRRVEWAGDDYILLWISRTAPLGIGFVASKIELTSVLVWDMSNKQMWTVFDKQREITGGVRGFHGIANHDGRWFGYFGGITLESGGKGESSYLGETTPELYEVDLRDRKVRRIARRHGEFYQDWLVGPDGKVAASLEFRSKDGAWRILDSSGKPIVVGQNLTGGIELLGKGSVGQTVLYSVQDEHTGVAHWYEVPLSGNGKPVELLANELVDDAILDRRTRQLIGYVKGGEQPEAQLFDPIQEQVMRSARRVFANRSIGLISWDENFERLLVKTDGNGDPGTWWLFDIGSGKVRKLGSSYVLNAAEIGPVKIVQYKAGDGLSLSGVLTLPPQTEPKNLPAIMFPHGGPAARDLPVFDWWAQALAARGYAVFQPNFRGSTGFGVALEMAGHGEWGRKMQTDISDGLAELVRQGIVDPKRVCIMGASYGGYAALAGVTLQQGLYRCAVSVSGVSDVQAMYATDLRNSGQDETLMRAMKEEVGSGKILKDISPIRFADKADAPVLLVHGKDDTVVMYEQSQAMERALRSAKKPVEMLTLSGEDHWLSSSVTRFAMLKATVEFIERNNSAESLLH